MTLKSMLQGSVSARVVGEMQEVGLEAVGDSLPGESLNRWRDFYSRGPTANSLAVFDPGIQLPLICRNSPECSAANMK